MGIIKRTNKKFDYQPRYYKSDKEGSPYKIQGKFDEHRSTLNTPRGLKGKFLTAWDEFNESRNKGYNKTIVSIVLLLVFLFLWIIDFDLSIFTKNSIF